jgi:hypothetical protein
MFLKAIYYKNLLFLKAVRHENIFLKAVCRERLFKGYMPRETILKAIYYT